MCFWVEFDMKSFIFVLGDGINLFFNLIGIGDLEKVNVIYKIVG